jgi:hypothetical protein
MIGAWTSLGVMGALMITFCVLISVALSDEDQAYDRQCHHHGGVVTHGGCFKPGSEIKF